MRSTTVLFALGAALTPAVVQAQLRIVTLNASNSNNANSGPRSEMNLILSAIGSSVCDDPTLPGNTGIAKPIEFCVFKR